jgi:hypothetical protein
LPPNTPYSSLPAGPLQRVPASTPAPVQSACCKTPHLFRPCHLPPSPSPPPYTPAHNCTAVLLAGLLRREPASTPGPVRNTLLPPLPQPHPPAFPWYPPPPPVHIPHKHTQPPPTHTHTHTCTTVLPAGHLHRVGPASTPMLVHSTCADRSRTYTDTPPTDTPTLTHPHPQQPPRPPGPATCTPVQQSPQQCPCKGRQPVHQCLLHHALVLVVVPP